MALVGISARAEVSNFDRLSLWFRMNHWPGNGFLIATPRFARSWMKNGQWKAWLNKPKGRLTP
jgi:hypothetical protein